MNKRMRRTTGVARLDRERINEQTHKHNIARSAVGIGELVFSEASRIDECGVDVMKHICPYFTNACKVLYSAMRKGLERNEACSHRGLH